MTNSSKQPRPGFSVLLPFLFFLAFYFGLSLWCGDFYAISMPIAFLVASCVALLLNRQETMEQKMDIIAQGMGDKNIMIMCMVFILAGAFANLTKGIGAMDAAVKISRYLIPDRFLPIGVFLTSCFLSIAIGTSCGTIAAITPIALAFAGPLNLPPVVLLSAAVNGSMFGDNLSMISDTTIAATRTQNVAMRDKFLTNLRIAIPATIFTVIIYLTLNNPNAAPASVIAPPVFRDILLILPYAAILICALFGMNVIMLLFCSILFSFVLGCSLHAAPQFWDLLKFAGDGCLGMSETLIVALLAGGLLQQVRHNGGIDYLLHNFSRQIHSVRTCEIGIMLLVFFVNIFTANNTVAIVITGPIAKGFSDKHQCDPKRIASILDTASCIIQGVLPYGAQILIATGLAKELNMAISPAALIRHLFYPQTLLFFLLCSILFHRETPAVPSQHC